MARIRRKVPSPCRGDKDKSSKCAFYKKCVLSLLPKKGFKTLAGLKAKISAADRICRKRAQMKFGSKRRRGASA